MLIKLQLVDVKWIDTSRIARVGFSRIEKYPERIRSTVVRGSIEMFLREYSCHAKRESLEFFASERYRGLF